MSTPSQSAPTSAPTSAPATEQTAETVFADLLTGSALPAAKPIHGVVVAELLALLPDGSVRLTVPAFALNDLLARPICALEALHVGQQVAVMFEQGDIARALVFGPMAQPLLDNTNPQPQREITVNQRRVVIEADDELELRCGEACIILSADGRIVSQANYITSHASVTQRLQGAAVQIN